MYSAPQPNLIDICKLEKGNYFLVNSESGCFLKQLKEPERSETNNPIKIPNWAADKIQRPQVVQQIPKEELIKGKWLERAPQSPVTLQHDPNWLHHQSALMSPPSIGLKKDEEEKRMKREKYLDSFIESPQNSEKQYQVPIETKTNFENGQKNQPPRAYFIPLVNESSLSDLKGNEKTISNQNQTQQAPLLNQNLNYQSPQRQSIDEQQSNILYKQELQTNNFYQNNYQLPNQNYLQSPINENPIVKLAKLQIASPTNLFIRQEQQQQQQSPLSTMVTPSKSQPNSPPLSASLLNQRQSETEFEANDQISALKKKQEVRRIHFQREKEEMVKRLDKLGIQQQSRPKSPVKMNKQENNYYYQQPRSPIQHQQQFAQPKQNPLKESELALFEMINQMKQENPKFLLVIYKDLREFLHQQHLKERRESK